MLVTLLHCQFGVPKIQRASSSSVFIALDFKSELPFFQKFGKVAKLSIDIRVETDSLKDNNSCWINPTIFFFEDIICYIFKLKWVHRLLRAHQFFASYSSRQTDFRSIVLP